MPETLPWLLIYTLAPVAAIVLGGCAAVARLQGRPLIPDSTRSIGPYRC
jgi:hypothetical protein